MRPACSLLAGALLACTLVTGTAVAQPAWPDRPLHIVVPAPTGGGMDALARALAESITLSTKQTVIVDNKPGASATIGANFVARAAPDGYTLLLVASSHALQPWTVKNLPYDTLKDFAPIALVATTPLVFVSSAQSGVKTVQDFRAFASRNQEAVPFAASAIETRLAAELVLRQVKAKSQIINYKGTGPAMTDVAGGHVPLFITTFSSVLPFRDTGKINFIGLAAKTRSNLWPELPTLAEQGLPIESVVWYGLLAPAGTPPAIVDRIHAEVVRASRAPAFLARLKTLTMDPATSSPAEFDAYIRAETTRWRDVVKGAGIEPE